MLFRLITQNPSQNQPESSKIQINQNDLQSGASKYLTRKNEQLFVSKTWFLGLFFFMQDKGKFVSDGWSQLMPLVIQLRWCQQLHLFKNNEENILKPLIYTKFKALRNITLDHNSIKNIQALQFIDAPNVKYLSLQNNLITNVKTLKKTNFQKLIVIQLYNNPLNQVNEISRANYPKTSQFYFSHMNPRFQNYQIHTFLEDVSVYVKFRHFQKYSKKRGSHVIRQQKVQNKISELAIQFYQ